MVQFLFSYHWTEAHCYLRIGKQEDNPVVTDWKNHYFAGSFEKYLFQKAFNIYQKNLSISRQLEHLSNRVMHY